MAERHLVKVRVRVRIRVRVRVGVRVRVRVRSNCGGRLQLRGGGDKLRSQLRVGLGGIRRGAR